MASKAYSDIFSFYSSEKRQVAGNHEPKVSDVVPCIKGKLTFSLLIFLKDRQCFQVLKMCFQLVH